jgi:hypothetical protein
MAIPCHGTEYVTLKKQRYLLLMGENSPQNIFWAQIGEFQYVTNISGVCATKI